MKKFSEWLKEFDTIGQMGQNMVKKPMQNDPVSSIVDAVVKSDAAPQAINNAKMQLQKAQQNAKTKARALSKIDPVGAVEQAAQVGKTKKLIDILSQNKS